MRRGAYSGKYGTKRYNYGFKRRPQISAAFWRKNLISFGTFPHALCNLTFTKKLLVKGRNKKKKLEALKSFSYFIFIKEIYCKNRGRRSCCLSTLDL